LAWLALAPQVALGQSATTLTAARLHQADSLPLAQAELSSCASSNCPRLNELSLLVGYLLLAQGRSSEAEAQLSSRPAPAGLEAFHAYYLAEAQFYARDKQAAVKGFTLAAERGPPWLQRRAKAREGEALLAADVPSLALPLLEQAAADRGGAELYYQRGLARLRAGNLEGARADFRWVAVRFASHPYGPRAVARLASNFRKFRFNLEERLARARNLQEAGMPNEALAELEDREKLLTGSSEKASAALIRAQALFALRREAEAEKQLDLTRKGPPSIAAEGALLRAKRALKADDNAKAHQLLAEINRKYPRENAADEAGILVGWIDLQADRLTEASAELAAFQQQHRSSHRLDEALWLQSFSMLLQRKHPEAGVLLQDLLRRFPRSALVPQARYWLARNAQLGGDSNLDGYEQIIRLFPGSYYALLASERLREAGRPIPTAFPDRPRSLEEPLPSRLQLASTLSQAGLARDAEEELQQRVESVHSAHQALQIGHALQRMGEFGFAYLLAAKLLWASAYGAKDPEAIALLYPRAHQTIVEQESRLRSIDPFLVWAIMRRESNFRTDAISVANARGLMQVFPATALQISKKLDVVAPEPDQLHSAGVNVRFACWYLAQLVSRFGHPALVAAAYNAGPAPVLKWLKARNSLPLDLFVERIPYRETRGYVKQVLADYFTYHALYGELARAPSLEITLPAAGEDGIAF
jgi:soluble lytic murein transglycosylase